MASREEFWTTQSAELIMDLLIDVTGRSSIRDALENIDPDYRKLLDSMKDYEQAYLDN